MRTTLRLDEDLMRHAKKLAAETGRTLTAVVEDALRESFFRRPASQPRERIKLPTFGSGGLLPGVDIDSSAALLDIVEEGRPL